MWAAFEHDGRTLVLLLSFKDEPVTATVTVGDGPPREETIEPYGTAVVIVD